MKDRCKFTEDTHSCQITFEIKEIFCVNGMLFVSLPRRTGTRKGLIGNGVRLPDSPAAVSSAAIRRAKTTGSSVPGKVRGNGGTSQKTCRFSVLFYIFTRSGPRGRAGGFLMTDHHCCIAMHPEVSPCDGAVRVAVCSCSRHAAATRQDQPIVIHMKQLFLWCFVVLATLGLAGCYNDDDLWNAVDDLDTRVTSIEERLDNLNSDIPSLSVSV